MTGARLIIPIAEPVLTNVGLVAAGSTLTIYNTGTTNLASLFADAALTTPIVNPLVANAAGRFYAQATVWWASSAIAYDYVLNVSDGTVITGDQIYTEGAPIDLSLYALLASPHFTGIPTAPTPATSDSSGTLATTMFVKNNLPTASQSVTGIVQLATSSQAIAGTNNTNALTPSTFKAGLTSANLAANSFAQSDAANGYITFPGGLILQWGITGTIPSHTPTAQAFPTHFASTCYAVTITSTSGTGTAQSHDSVQSVTTSSFTMENAAPSSATFYFMAVGK